MNIERYQTPNELYNVVEKYLREKEIENGLMLGLLKSDDYPTSEEDLYIAIQDNESTFVCIKRGKGLIFAGHEKDFKSKVDLLIEYLDEHELKYPSILGPKHIVEYFKGQLVMRGITVELGMSQRIYGLDKLIDIETSQGELKLATLDNLNLVIPWFQRFGDSAGDDVDAEYARSRMKNLIENKKLYLWTVDSQPVSMVASIRDVGDGVTVSMVYTPIEERKKGYASSAVWHINRMLLNNYKYTMLYTDLSNPTSNKIYMNIGYKPVVDSMLYMIKE